MMIACPQCAALNQLPAGEAALTATCDKCSSLLFRDEPATVDRSNISAYWVDSDVPMLIQFWSPSCPQSQEMYGVTLQAVQKLKPYVAVGRLNADDGTLSDKFEIREAPAFVVAHKMQVLEQNPEPMDLEMLVTWVKNVVSIP